MSPHPNLFYNLLFSLSLQAGVKCYIFGVLNSTFYLKMSRKLQYSYVSFQLCFFSHPHTCCCFNLSFIMGYELHEFLCLPWYTWNIFCVYVCVTHDLTHWVLWSMPLCDSHLHVTLVSSLFFWFLCSLWWGHSGCERKQKTTLVSM